MSKPNKTNGEQQANDNGEVKQECFVKRVLKRTWRYAVGAAVGVGVTAFVFARGAAKSRNEDTEESEEATESENSVE